MLRLVQFYLEIERSLSCIIYLKNDYKILKILMGGSSFQFHSIQLFIYLHAYSAAQKANYGVTTSKRKG
jgi:hypothetical protein